METRASRAEPVGTSSHSAPPSSAAGSLSSRNSSGAPFLTTRWSVVRNAAGSDEPRARAALAELCAAYWKPLWAYARRRGRSHEDASDLTQGFFARLLEQRAVGAADPGCGRFRSYLLGAFKHFLANEWDRERTLKRGGGRTLLSLDFGLAGADFALEPADAATPEHAFDRDWALAVLERAYGSLRESYAARGRVALFDALRTVLAPTGATPTYRALGLELGLSEGAVKVAAHRLRRAFRASLRAEIGQTVESEADLELELTHLIEALGPPRS
jgi:RNA polymerase sigma factor (sigma-70 family)